MIHEIDILSRGEFIPKGTAIVVPHHEGSRIVAKTGLSYRTSMQLSKKSEYAVRAITILAAEGPDRSLQANEMAVIGDIPQKFLEQILLILKRSGLVISKRGVGGGYRIAREPRLITVAEVILSMEGEETPMPTLDQAGTFPGAAGLAHCFTAASDAYRATLEKTTIDDLLNHQTGDAMVGYGI